MIQISETALSGGFARCPVRARENSMKTSVAKTSIAAKTLIAAKDLDRSDAGGGLRRRLARRGDPVGWRRRSRGPRLRAARPGRCRISGRRRRRRPLPMRSICAARSSPCRNSILSATPPVSAPRPSASRAGSTPIPCCFLGRPCSIAAIPTGGSHRPGCR